ncbi:MAG: DMT family transporter [Candidatus Tectomicrobia bacterium]|uniref:DMT family transporter n=1 Tax=Tectimicrobiota bacterium TaxID=2528274 RepID=A0A932MKH5_UNCTE|nr:DMT family transporter [Candidatus Tectomicrobia bacterium]
MIETAALFALCAAFLLALRDIFGRFGVRGLDPIVGTAVSAVAGLPVLLAISLALGDFARPWPARSWTMASIALAGILRITAARTLLFAASQHIGAARAGTLGTTSAFFSMALGIAFLDERLTLMIAAGAALVIGGSVLMARSRPGGASPQAEGLSYLKGVALALLSALVFGTSSVLVRPAVNDFASPNLANLYANLFAALCFLPFCWGRLGATRMGEWSLGAWAYLIAAGSAASLGVTFMYLALARAPVVFVTPISQSRPFFLVLVSWLFLQAHESVNRRVAWGAAAIVVGTGVLILSR